MAPLTSVLSERQKEELHRALLDYLSSNGLQSTFEALKAELPAHQDFQPDPKAKWTGLLEKKWTSVIRLQKKIMDLERENGLLKDELASVGSISSTRKGQQLEDWLPGRGGGARHTLTGHRSPITALAFHPTFSSLASASEDCTIKVWDYETGEFELTLKGHTKVVCDVDYDSKGTFLVSCSSDLTIKLWDCMNNYRCTKTLYDHDHSVSSSRFLPGDTHIVSASRDQTIKIWEVATSFCVKTLRGHTEWVRGVWPWTHGKLLVSASNDQTARIWDLTTGESKIEFRGHEHVVEIALFSPPASNAAIREMAGIPSPTNQDSKIKEPDPVFVATGSRDKTIRIWDCNSGQCIKTLVGHDNWIRALVFHPNGRHLLSSSDDKTIRAWELRTGRCVKVVDAHEHFVTSMAWGRASAGGGPPTTNPDSNQPLNSLSSVAARPVSVIATGSVDQSIKIWTP
ncbi:protein with putative role during mitosis [Puccinia graminis f. sp. tritici]|uniref:Nuclear distribution protein PAC1 n=2 Tax=Puccinia graminis f. sp. tritici TaxID=56615 RepID=E3KSX6_PUCGT|nr:1-alkyl-2-acetylglycerophosphocholine esterase [Puccinia graminis f. sp. tritici CRL 75-36-700-3]EFP87362.1 1-alkyl-2-acetylglycerophosphocholine esterase [Puccinia graminis f. sp. tritici CRL 75-36-700-3]KAA1089531.1 protein with putative role during mitosis, variant 2 [Puccinia graminis f. sp. tritici]KAA1093019.1 protein with putative role during mitosis [Puccinia graminis f. sp. tritici]KAA1115652.1 protein with putative role during mitosis [Puccinia graminis f. sp. tritici]